MTEKRFFMNCSGYICDMDMANALTLFEVIDIMNNLYEEKQKVKKVLQKYLDEYTRRAIEGHPYADVTDAISDIADELGVELE